MWYSNIDQKQYQLFSSIDNSFLGRFIILKIQIDDKVYVVVNIYAPNKHKDLIQFFIENYLEKHYIRGWFQLSLKS